MIALIQRVTEASVSISGSTTAAIERGLLVLVGVQKQDTERSATHLAQRILGYRVFPDDNDRMNLDVVQSQGALLMVPQFTLAAETHKGKRPGFSSAADPGQATLLFQLLCDSVAEQVSDVKTGTFGANMQVALINDGPVTFWLSTDVR